jgi:hypothetical protein
MAYLIANFSGHDHLLEIRLLKDLLDTILLLLDTVRAIIFFLVNCSKIKNHEKSSAVRLFRAVSLLDKKISTVRKSYARQRWWKMSTARHNL